LNNFCNEDAIYDDEEVKNAESDDDILEKMDLETQNLKKHDVIVVDDEEMKGMEIKIKTNKIKSLNQAKNTKKNRRN